MELPEWMDPFFAVFNGHLNDADRRARAEMGKKCPTWLAKVEAAEREGNGIMVIFQEPPNRATQRYVDLVHAFVNENRAPKPQPSDA